MSKYTMEDFKKGEFIVHTVNEKEARNFLELCEANDIVWRSGNRATDPAIGIGMFRNVSQFEMLTYFPGPKRMVYELSGGPLPGTIHWSQIDSPAQYRIRLQKQKGEIT